MSDISDYLHWLMTEGRFEPEFLLWQENMIKRLRGEEVEEPE